MSAPHPVTFGVLLRRFRKAARLTQEALAERAGYSTVYIGMLERGERTAPLPRWTCWPRRSNSPAPSDCACLPARAMKQLLLSPRHPPVCP